MACASHSRCFMPAMAGVTADAFHALNLGALMPLSCMYYVGHAPACGAANGRRYSVLQAISSRRNCTVHMRHAPALILSGCCDATL